MLLSAILAAAAGAAHLEAPSRPAHPRLFQQATATVRIVAGSRITPGSKPEDAIVTEAKVHDAQGKSKAVRLIEFP